jgi:hypothetical protein
MESESCTPEKCSCKHKKCVLIFFAALLLAGIACWYVHHPNRAHHVGPKPGEQCIVQLRRDALGGAANLPVSPLTDNINGATVALGGWLVAVNHEAIVLDCHASQRYFKRLWIPNSSILLIAYEMPKE